MKFKVTERTVAGDIIQERQREYEFDTFEEFQEFLFLSGSTENFNDIVGDIFVELPPDDEEDEEE